MVIPRTSLYRDSLYRGSTVQICRTLRPRPLVRIWTNRNKLSVHTKSVNLFTETTSFRISLQSGLRALSTRLRVKKIRGFKPFRFRVDKSQWYMRRNVSGSYAKQYGEQVEEVRKARIICNPAMVQFRPTPQKTNSLVNDFTLARS